MDEKEIDQYLDEIDRLMAPLGHFFSGRYHEKWGLGLTYTQMFILRKLSRKPEFTMTQLAEALGISTAAMTKVIDQLVQGNYLERKRSEVDRRVIILQLTEAGKQIIEEAIRTRRTLLKELLSDLPASDLQALFRIVQKIHDKVNHL